MKRTYIQYRKILEKLSESQKNWLRNKAQWEHMTPWAVMCEWRIPQNKNLESDGTWKGNGA